MKKPNVPMNGLVEAVLKRLEMAARDLLCDVEVLDYERKSALLAIMDVAKEARKANR